MTYFYQIFEKLMETVSDDSQLDKSKYYTLCEMQQKLITIPASSIKLEKQLQV